MNTLNAPVTSILLGINILLSLLAFSNTAIRERMLFWPYKIFNVHQYDRFITHAWIHSDIGHLGFNMLALFSFGSFAEQMFRSYWGSAGTYLFLTMYLLSIPLSCLPDYFLMRNKVNYRALGASGAVSAVIFSVILFNPTGKLYVFFIPMWNFVFAPLYIILSVVMSKRGGDGVAHRVHLGGAFIGLFFPIVLRPELASEAFYKIKYFLGL